MIDPESEINAISHDAPIDLEMLEQQFESSKSVFDYDEDPQANLMLQPGSLNARKRDTKGSYKARLSLDKLIVERERKRLQIVQLREKYD